MQHEFDAAELNAFSEVIHASTTYNTLVCVDAAGTPFTRIWCLHELDHTLQAGGDKLRLLTLKGKMASHMNAMLYYHGQATTRPASQRCEHNMHAYHVRTSAHLQQRQEVPLAILQ